jgi:HUS1 checkpoint protein
MGPAVLTMPTCCTLIALMQPAQLLCGIAERGAYVHIMFVYRDPFSDGGYDDDISLSLRVSSLVK